MDQNEDPRELELKIERANRIASRVTDQTTIELLGAWVKELRQKLRQLLDARRTKHEIKARARELWEQNGCPQAVTWSSGFKPSLKSRRVNGRCEAISLTPCLDRPELSIKLP